MTSETSTSTSSQATIDGLSSIWKRLLGHDSFERDDSFFDVGGHSLIANRLCLAIEERFGVRLSVIDIFDHPTLNQQFRRISGAIG
jgi:phthiocerol/phenolphthiocerol synthesis type-I polyketide synthase E